ncbi:hypothetical protein DFA_04286 [Cavenderia fasciculata]|uniref:AAA-ATPase-like domain-containing protein n=1 Tax=Cavenderia fasciculata TaxID=261658 RepID=F4PP55_CACFS|nr:uncharacterized protein DFA_04286 [Cavenderia fasciculata]EGG22168.1 hypothetical protein DFA_04286 [Cavenderia fasciculata]|eukprot:XP_004360019.1 hypothetical protein DFA_04286 [Cavenderia fasciculata]
MKESDCCCCLDSLDAIVESSQSLGIPLYILIDSYSSTSINYTITNASSLVQTISTESTKVISGMENVLNEFFGRLHLACERSNNHTRAFITDVTPLALSNLYTNVHDLTFDSAFSNLYGYQECDVLRGLDLIPHLSKAKKTDVLNYFKVRNLSKL